jgi:tetratricopeptide (TPR) repeat protein
MRRSFAGYARGMQGDIAGGHAAMDQAIADIEATRSTNSLCLHYALFAEMCVRQGDLDRGQASAARALTFTANGERFAETIAYRALGLCAAARGAAHRDEALERLRQSVALADARGGHPNAAIGRYHLARVLNDAGDRDAALDHLAAAQSCFAELGMPTWRDTAARMAL